MPKGRIVLLAALGVVAAIETVGIFTDTDTVSGLTASVFRTDTTTGRWIFGAAWLGFAGWFLWHLMTFSKSVKNQSNKIE